MNLRCGCTRIDNTTGSMEGCHSMMWCVAPANCSAATASWTESTYSCTAPLTAKNHNTTVTLTDNTGTDTGVATYKCWDGTWTKQKGGCGPACPAETKNWTVGSNACSASIATGIPGQTKTANDTTLNPNRGKATYLYSAGTWVEQPGATCAPCSPVDGGWSSGCGYTRTCDNPAPYCGGRYCTGSAYISCPSFSECGCKETCTSTYDLWCGPNSGNYACGKQIFNACYSCTTVCSSGSPGCSSYVGYESYCANCYGTWCPDGQVCDADDLTSGGGCVDSDF